MVGFKSHDLLACLRRLVYSFLLLPPLSHQLCVTVPETAATMPPKKKKVPRWTGNCEGKKLLDRDVRKGAVTQHMSLQAIYDMHREEYEKYGETPEEAFRLFKGRVARAFASGTRDSNRSAVEAAALQQDRLTHPRPAMFAGAPQWEGSEAQRLMKEDVAAGKDEGKTPTQFRLTRPEYQVYTSTFIGGHMKQEVKLRKWNENRPGRIQSLPANHN